MNEKIKDLASQAGFVGESMYPIFGTCQETALTNFVELIQQDCLQHLTNTGQDHAREILERYFTGQ